VELRPLTEEDFVKILSEPQASLVKQYVALLESEEVKLEFQDAALGAIADTAFKINSEVENIGARRLHTVMSRLLNDILFDVPDKIGPNAQIVITPEMVDDKLATLVQNRDLSEYIL